MALEVGRGVGTFPIDARRQPLDAIALDAKRLALACHLPVTGAAGERDAALARGGRRRGDLARRAALEDPPQQGVGAGASRGRDREALYSRRAARGGEPRRRLAGFGKIGLVEWDA